jgi:hypothetical protein
VCVCVCVCVYTSRRLSQRWISHFSFLSRCRVRHTERRASAQTAKAHASLWFFISTYTYSTFKSLSYWHTNCLCHGAGHAILCGKQVHRQRRHMQRHIVHYIHISIHYIRVHTVYSKQSLNCTLINIATVQGTPYCAESKRTDSEGSCSGLWFLISSDPVNGGIFSQFGLSLITVYTIFVLAIGREVRATFTGDVPNTMYTVCMCVNMHVYVY